MYVQNRPRNLTWAHGTAAASGDNTIVTAPGANLRIRVAYAMVQNTTATATTAIWQNGAADVAGALLQNQGDALTINLPHGDEWEFDANTAVTLNLSGANSHRYSIAYWTEAETSSYL